MQQWAKKELNIIKNVRYAEVISKKNNASERILQRESRANCVRYQELRRKTNRICKKKEGRMRKQLEEVNKFKEQDERQKCYNERISTKK
jgi:hypothetical protein